MAKNHFLGLKSEFFGSKSSASLEFQILDLWKCIGHYIKYVITQALTK